MHGFFVFEIKIIIFLTNFIPFFLGKVFTHKKFLDKLLYGLRPMLRFCHTVNIYMFKTIEGRVNIVAIPTTGKSCSLYRELLKPVWVIYQ
jgi:hypothetical protein